MRDLFQFELMLPTGGSFGGYGGGDAITNYFYYIDKGIRRGIDSIRLDRWGDGGGSSGNSGSGGGNTSNINCRESTEVLSTNTTTTTTTSPGFTISNIPPFLHFSTGLPVTTTTNSASVTRKITCEK
jgi:hypothetical protein